MGGQRVGRKGESGQGFKCGRYGERAEGVEEVKADRHTHNINT